MSSRAVKVFRPLMTKLVRKFGLKNNRYNSEPGIRTSQFPDAMARTFGLTTNHKECSCTNTTVHAGWSMAFEFHLGGISDRSDRSR